MKKNMLVAGALVGSVLLLSGCQMDVAFGEREQDVVSYGVSDKLTALDVHTGSGSIVVTGSDRSDTRVTETLHWNGDKKNKPKTEHKVDGGTLTLRQECPTGNCSVDYKVEIPKGLTAKVDTGSGTITLRALTGEVNANTGSGDVEADALGGRQLVAETGSGDIEAKFAVAPDQVEIQTGSGDATVRLPQGPYDVTADSGTGGKTVKVTNDPSSPKKISVRTGSGQANVLAS
ncbi:DUF4097 family beta strand repeat-containing protein [Streptosporangium sp. NPDC000396]|uniref:DUF4097 family beta strand repeat-containing protein n=1 Tax=Streptosporangium sp. NPDC000396 TaxID=3366185 RepID=UPI0036A2FBA1